MSLASPRVPNSGRTAWKKDNPKAVNGPADRQAEDRGPRSRQSSPVFARRTLRRGASSRRRRQPGASTHAIGFRHSAARLRLRSGQDRAARGDRADATGRADRARRRRHADAEWISDHDRPLPPRCSDLVPRIESGKVKAVDFKLEAGGGAKWPISSWSIGSSLAQPPKTAQIHGLSGAPATLITTCERYDFRPRLSTVYRS